MEIGENAGFWLPTEFLDDDMFSAGQEQIRSTQAVEMVRRGCFFSDARSLVPAQSQEDESFVDGLSHRLARSTLLDDKSSASKTKSKVMGSSCGRISSLPGVSQVSPPTSTQLAQETEDALSLLYAAAGEMAGIRLLESEFQLLRHEGHGLFAHPEHPPLRIHHSGYFQGGHASPLQQQIQFRRLRHEQLIKQQIAAGVGDKKARGGILPSSPWEISKNHQHPQVGTRSGMSASFLNSPSRKVSTGTGVFLPRAANPPLPKKKSVCSTVLVPSKVVQALNLNFDDLSLRHRYPRDCLVGDVADLPPTRVISSARSHATSFAAVPAAAAGEIRLPPEWTY